jgi:hypothetical protein
MQTPSQRSGMDSERNQQQFSEMTFEQRLLS